MKRVPSHELLDNDEGTPSEVSQSLADLLHVNRRFGGIRTTQSMIHRVAKRTGRRKLSLLEVAAGSGAAVREVGMGLTPFIDLQITLLDRLPTHLGESRPAIAADALALPVKESGFDLVSCNLFCHHLGEKQNVEFIREALRVCRVAVLINDLIRDPVHLALVYAGFPFFRSRLTRNDAPASVRQAYTIAEMRRIVHEAGAQQLEIERQYLYRMAVIAWKQAADGA
jgi:ubiquinone/menaquinone biosynthesis C-methylase UbiE